MIRAYLIIACYVIAPILIILCFKKWTWAQKIGTVVMAYAIGIILAITGACSFADNPEAATSFSKMQSLLMSITVPLAIPLMLFNCDFRLWTKALPKTIWSLCGGLLSVATAVITGYLIFQHRGIPEFEKMAAMLTGIYTGGTMNFNALGASLGIDKSVMAIVLAFQMLITTPYIFFLLAGGYKIFRKALPYNDEAIVANASMGAAVNDVENYHNMFDRRNLLGMLKGLGLSLLCLAIGAGVALALTGTLNELVIILTITTLAIALSFWKPVRSLPKTFELGMFFILIFSLVVASLFNWRSVSGESLMIGLFVLWIILVGGGLHLLFCRITKVSGDLFTVSQVALLCSPPFVPPIVGAMGNKKVLLSGIVVGLIGYAIGTYLGVAIFLLLSAI